MITVDYKYYLDDLSKEFPDVDKKALRDLVRHGLTKLSAFKRYDHDIFLNNPNGSRYIYMGMITNDLEKRKLREFYRVRHKYRALYRIAKTQYDGYYYFGLSEEDYQKHLKKEPIPKVVITRLFKETELYTIARHFFRIKMDKISDWLFVEENYETSSAEYFCRWTENGPESISDTK